MLTEFHVSFMGTSSNSDFFILKEDQKQTDLQISSIPTSQVEEREEQKQERDHKEEELKKQSLGQTEACGGGDDDGFRTPTSLAHKLPKITQCPPAPRKIRLHPSRKRKISQSLEIELSREVDSMFPIRVHEDLGRKIKKARREDTK
ncbi:Cyclin-dependent protein kinase [Actinidia chinensis var. chinensis]|uniref:Cyclin-dependent protein kinase n=1 Tax=Actinidia chinensis var. chinensis TaxID=1590841 RepID=A0A2R6PWX8_ACTCC|nr:Cyclin-dependent protein kinase [Actinidia chinensis var. chinensis]